MCLRASVLAVLFSLAVVPGARAAVAPGLVTAPISAAPTFVSVDPFAATAAALTPDGGVVTAGIDPALRRLVVARFAANGTPVATFGQGGVASLAIPTPKALIGPIPHRVLIDAEGRALVVAEGPPSGSGGESAATVTRVLPTGALDPAYGTGGTATSTLSGSAAALQPDGQLVLCGATGAYGPPVNGVPQQGTRAWSCTRLHPDGSTDTGFGANGITKLPGVGAFGVALLGDGRIAATGSDMGSGSRLTLLRADGTIDPGFNGGAPVALGLLAEDPVVHGDRIDVLSGYSSSRTVSRYRPDGTLDPAFGSGGATGVPGNGFAFPLVAGPDGSDLVVTTETASMTGNLRAGVRVVRLRSEGSPDPAWGGAQGLLLEPGFGGGLATFRATIRLPLVGSLDQRGFTATQVLSRGDGGLILAGSTAVIQYQGEGSGIMHEEIGVAAFRPDHTPDPAFGGPAGAATLRASVPPQRIRTIATRRSSRAVRVVLATSGPGLAEIRVQARGRLVAHTIAPSMRAGAGQRALAYFTAAGRRLLTAHAHGVKATVRVTFRDLVGRGATVTTHGVLR